MDKTIGKSVLKLEDPNPLSTFIQLPSSSSVSLALVGRHCYLQVNVPQGQHFLIQLDTLDINNNVIRISLSNMFRQIAKKRNARGVQVPLNLADEECNVWQTIAIDMATILEQQKDTTFRCLRGIKICANLAVRGVFTSDLSYEQNDFPREMVLSMAQDPSCFQLRWIPQKPQRTQALSDNSLLPPQSSPVRRPRPPRLTRNIQQKHTQTSLPKTARESPSLKSDDSPSSEKQVGEKHKLSPILQIKVTNGFTGEYTGLLVWVPNTDEVIFAASNVLIGMNESRMQRRFVGHTSPVCALSIDEDGRLLASAQEGLEPIIRLWNVQSGHCTAAFRGHESSMIALDISPDGSRLVGVGLDECKRQLVVIWNIHSSCKECTVSTVCYTISTANIKSVKWSRHENDRLFTCGRENIRMYRIKGDRLRSMPLNLHQDGSTQKKTFTCIAVDHAPSLKPHHPTLLVGSSSGAVYQIDYQTFVLLRVHKLHDSAINCMVMSEGYCAIGSDDTFLRVWPRDFQDYLLQAENESPVTSISLSSDGLKICLGTESGAVSLLDIVSHTHETILRSHTDVINAVAILPQYSPVAKDPTGLEFLTGGLDGTMRQWKLSSALQNPVTQENVPRNALDFYLDVHPKTGNDQAVIHGDFVCSQTHEFQCDSDNVLCISSPTRNGQVAVGFASGSIRILDTESSTILHEFQHQEGKPVDVEFCLEGSKLFSCSDTGYLIVYEALTDYRPIKQMLVSDGQYVSSLAISPNSRIAVSTPTDMLVMCIDFLKPIFKIATASKRYNKVLFSSDGKEIWAVEYCPSSLDVFDADSGVCLAQIADLTHPSGVSAFGIDDRKRFYITGGRDGLIKVWRYPCFRPSKPISISEELQRYCSHSCEIKDLKIMSEILITIGADASILVWEIQNDTSYVLTNTDAQIVPTKQKAPVTMHDFHLDPTVFGLSTNLQHNFIWHSTTDLFAFVVGSFAIVEDLKTKDRRYLRHHQQAITALCVSTDGLLLSTSSTSHEPNQYTDICLWNTLEDKPIAVLQHYLTPVKALAFSLDGLWLVSVSSGNASNVVVWDIASRTPVAIGSAQDSLPMIQFLPNAPTYRFVTSTPRTILLWDLQVDSLTQTIVSLEECLVKDDSILCWTASFPESLLGVSAFGHLVAYRYGKFSLIQTQITSEEAASIFLSCHYLVIGSRSGKLEILREHEDSGQWTVLGCLELGSEVLSIHFDATFQDGLVSTADSSIWCISVPEMSCSRLMTGLRMNLDTLNLCHSPLLSAAFLHLDKTVRVVDLESGTLLREIYLDQDCCCVKVSLDGSLIVCGFKDGSLFLIQETKTRKIHALKQPILRIGISSDCKQILTVCKQGYVCWSRLEEAEDKRSLSNKNDGFLLCCDISTDLEIGAFAWDQKFAVYRLLANEDPHLLFHHPLPPNQEDGNPCAVLALTENSEFVAYFGSRTCGEVLLVNVQTRSIQKKIQLDEVPSCLTSSYYSEKIFFAASQNKIFEIDFQTNRFRRVLHENSDMVIGIRSTSRGLCVLHSDHLSIWTYLTF